MRKIGELPGRKQAVRFVDFMLTKNVSVVAEPSGQEDDPWMVWVRDEDHLVEARDELSLFKADSTDSRYDAAEKAGEIRRKKEEENKKKLQLQKKVSGTNWGGSGAYLTQKPKLTIGLVVICVVIFFVTEPYVGHRAPPPDDRDTGAEIYQTLRYVDEYDFVSSEGDPAASISQGEIWRVFTPNLLHGGMMHLAFNMLALFFLGGAIERLQSPLALGILILFTGIIAIVVQSQLPAKFGGSPNVVGISGAIYGLFGYLWIRPILQPTFPNIIPPSTVMLMLLFMVMFIIMPRGSMGGISVANVAHVAGLVAGILCAAIAARLPA